MVTYRQIIRKVVRRLKKKHSNLVGALKQNPFKRGIIMRIGTESPKKPNSAKRRVAKVKLCTGKQIRAQVPGEGFGPLARFSRVMIRGGRTRDLPGVRYRIIRGKFDSTPVFERRKGRSKYGLKRKFITMTPTTALTKKKKK